MQHDEVIWQTIRHNHCSFMAKIVTGNFCRNPYNVTGICNRSSCPLANSRYATIRDHDGVFFLYIKTIERAHKPNDLWEKIKLPRNYEKAMEIIDKHMQYWPKFLVHKIKQRLTKMTQYRIRMRKLQLKVREKTVTLPRKETKREPRREKKAEKAAVFENKIEKELLERLNKTVYGEIYNYPQTEYLELIDKKEQELKELQGTAEEEEEPEIEYVEGDFEDNEDMEDFGGPVIDKALIDDADDEDVDDEDFAQDDLIGKKVRSKGKRSVIIEVEHESGTGRKQKVQKLLVGDE